MNTRIALGAGTLALLICALGPSATFLGAINIGPTSSVEISIVVLGGVALVALSALTGRNMRLASISYLTVIVGVLLIASTWLVRRPEPAVA
jgi:hypothetical protein